MPRRRTSLKKQRVDAKRHLRNLKAKQQFKKTVKKLKIWSRTSPNILTKNKEIKIAWRKESKIY